MGGGVVPLRVDEGRCRAGIVRGVCRVRNPSFRAPRPRAAGILIGNGVLTPRRLRTQVFSAQVYRRGPRWVS